MRECAQLHFRKGNMVESVDGSASPEGAENSIGFVPAEPEFGERFLNSDDESPAGRFLTMSLRLRKRFVRSVRNIENFRLPNPSPAANLVCADKIFDSEYSIEFSFNSRLLFESSAGPTRLMNAWHPTAHHAAFSFARDVHHRVNHAQAKFFRGQVENDELFFSFSDLRLLHDPAGWDFVREMVLTKFGAAAAEIDLTMIPALMTLECAFVVRSLRATAKKNSPNWPPDLGWHFRPGQFAFRKRFGKLNGIPWATLQLLATRKYAVSSLEIKEGIWPDPEFVHDSSVRKAVGAARKALRRVFELPDTVDPIPNEDKGDRCAWAIDENVLRERAIA